MGRAPARQFLSAKSSAIGSTAHDALNTSNTAPASPHETSIARAQLMQPAHWISSSVSLPLVSSPPSSADHFPASRLDESIVRVVPALVGPLPLTSASPLPAAARRHHAARAPAPPRPKQTACAHYRYAGTAERPLVRVAVSGRGLSLSSPTNVHSAVHLTHRTGAGHARC